MNEQSLIEKSAPRVSIVIPVYNREKYLGIAVDSVLRQTYQDWELIISDDGSIDGTLDVAYNFALYDDRIRVLTAEHQGAVYALIAGFNAARGEFVGQLDSDDLLEPPALELTVRALDEHLDWGIVYTNYVDISASGQKTRPGKRCSIPYSKERLLTDFMVFHFRLIRKFVYQEIGGFNIEFDKLEDYELCLRLSETTNIGKINDYLYQYRIHPESLRVTMDELERIRLCEKAMIQALSRRQMDKTNRVKVSLTATFSIELLEGLIPQYVPTSNPIFVIGAARSGTTLLRLLLTAHSDICIPPESLFFVALEPKYGGVDNLLPQVEDFLTDLYSENFSKFREWNVNREILSNNLKSYQNLSYALAVETVYKTYCQQHNPKTLIWGDKNPSHIYYLETIRQYFPMSKVILIVRDFRACYSSMKNIIVKEQETKEVWTGPKTLKEMEYQWSQVVNLIDEYYQKNEQFYLVSYERLIKEPSVQLTKICEWLGVNFQETMLNFYQKNIELNLVSPNRAVFHPNTFKPIDRERIDNWRSELTIAEIEAIQVISGKNLEKLGYKCI